MPKYVHTSVLRQVLEKHQDIQWHLPVLPRSWIPVVIAPMTVRLITTYETCELVYWLGFRILFKDNMLFSHDSIG